MEEIKEINKNNMEEIKYYSQANQDRWVVDMLNHKKNGFFLDVGAFDGVDISNTYVLEKKFNWDGICIDADPVNFKKLTKERNVTCINCAVSNESGTIDFSGNKGAGSHVSENGSQSIESKTMEDILRQNNCPKIIDYISLDIEGHEVKALEKFPFDEYEFKLMTVEHNLYLGDKEHKNKIKEILLKNGYKIYKEDVINIGNDPFEDWYINPKYFTI